jgi:hypothetical protein
MKSDFIHGLPGSLSGRLGVGLSDISFP